MIVKNVLELSEYRATGKTPAEVAKWAKAESEERLVVLPCKPGEKLYVLAQKSDHVGNDYDYLCSYDKEACSLYEPDVFTDIGGYTHSLCKTDGDGKCPIVVKPITAELFEVDESGVYPCYYVSFEGNSRITDYHKTPEEAAAALEKGAAQ